LFTHCQARLPVLLLPIAIHCTVTPRKAELRTTMIAVNNFHFIFSLIMAGNALRRRGKNVDLVMS